MYFHLKKIANQIELVIEDNGIGFSLDEIYSRSPYSLGLGLSSMKQRTEQTGGQFSVEFGSNNKGAVIRSVWVQGKQII